MTTQSKYIDFNGDFHVGDNILHLQRDGSITISNVITNDCDDVSNWCSEIVANAVLASTPTGNTVVGLLATNFLHILC